MREYVKKDYVAVGIVLLVIVGLIGCELFERDRKASSSTPAGQAEALANYGGASVLEGQWCLTVAQTGLPSIFRRRGAISCTMAWRVGQGTSCSG
jgi:hypothetical protein